MAANSEQEQRIKELETQLEAVLDLIRGKELVSRPAWGALSFEDIEPEISGITSTCERLGTYPWRLVPATEIAQVVEGARACVEAIESLDNFSLTMNEPASQRQHIISRVRQAWHQLFHASFPLEAYLAVRSSGVDQKTHHLSILVDNIASTQKKTQDESEAYLEELRKKLESASETTATLAIGAHVKVFDDESVECASNATKWLVATTILAGLTIAVILLSYFLAPQLDGVSEITQFVVTKALILAVLLGASTWCAGNYKANRHQATVNKHKAHALATFRAFVHGTDSPSIKDAVLIEATRAVFAHTQSGFLKADSVPDSGSRIVEIVKGTLGGKES